MTRSILRTLTVEATVDAPLEAVWPLVVDVTRTGEWSHECREVFWLGGVTAAVPGARFRGRNRSWLWRWSRTCEVVDVVPFRQLTWRTIPTVVFHDSSQWRITVEPARTGTGTRIVQSYEVVWAPAWWSWVMSRLNPQHLDRTEALTADLVRIGEVADPGPGQRVAPPPHRVTRPTG